MVKNIGSHIRFYCMEHKTPVPFVEDGNHPQFICAHHFRKDEEHPDGYEEEKCDEVLRFTDYEKIVGKIEERIEKDSVERVEANYKGLRFSYKTLKAVVIKHSEKHIDVGITYTIKKA